MGHCSQLWFSGLGSWAWGPGLHFLRALLPPPPTTQPPTEKSLSLLPLSMMPMETRPAPLMTLTFLPVSRCFLSFLVVPPLLDLSWLLQVDVPQCTFISSPALGGSTRKVCLFGYHLLLSFLVIFITWILWPLFLSRLSTKVITWKEETQSITFLIYDNFNCKK